MQKSPLNGQSYRVAFTGFGNPVRLSGGACKAVIISARIAIAGLSGGDSTDNAQPVLVNVGSNPTSTTSYIGTPVSPGQTQIFNVSDSGMIYMDGANGDSVNVEVLF